MTKLKNIISTTEARRNIFKLTEDIQKPGNYYTFTEKGTAKAVLLSADEFESMRATIETLIEDPDLPELSRQANLAVETGDFSDYIPLEQLIKESGYSVAEKKGEYVLQRAVSPRGKKAISQASWKNSK